MLKVCEKEFELRSILWLLLNYSDSIVLPMRIAVADFVLSDQLAA
jgi:hypothetical protein